MDPMIVRWLAGPGRAVLADIDPDEDPLTGIPRLRRLHTGIDQALLTAAWTLARVRTKHAERLGPAVRTAVLTDDLAQQASRAIVAAHRADRICRSGARWVHDGACGAGLDALALTARGIEVSATDIDPVAAECARVNLGHGTAAGRGVEVADITAIDLPPCDVVYVDPARRTAAGPRRDAGRAPIERDPQRWSPPWGWVVQAAMRRRVVAKCAPGIPAGLLPRDAEVEWVAVGRDIAEATVWFGGGPLRRATLLRPDGQVMSIAAARPAARPAGAAAGRVADGDPVPAPGGWLLEPNEAIQRAGLIDVLADELGLERVHPTSSWLISEQPVESPWVSAWRVMEWVEATRMRARLRGSGPTTYKTADTPNSAEEIARRVGHRPVTGAPGRTVVVIGSSRRMALVTRDE